MLRRRARLSLFRNIQNSNHLPVLPSGIWHKNCPTNPLFFAKG
jgi:hypothetical protein